MKKRPKPVKVKDLKPAKAGSVKGGTARRITNSRANASVVGGGG